MQQWEYMVVHVSEALQVTSINRQSVATEKKSGLFSSTTYEGEWLHEFLSKVGLEGWEVIGLNPTTTGGETRTYSPCVLLLKRPLP